MKNRKPFSLEKWRTLGDRCKVFTKNGSRITDLSLHIGSDEITSGLCGMYNNCIIIWNVYGTLRTNPFANHVANNLDLELEYESTTITKYINIYSNGRTSILYDERKSCDAINNSVVNKRIACVPIEIEYCEGDGLD